MYRRFSRAFTLVELLVVVAIISLLSSIVYSNVNEARANARDAKRVVEAKTLQTSAELYFSTFGYYPGAVQGYDQESPSLYTGDRNVANGYESALADMTIANVIGGIPRGDQAPHGYLCMTIENIDGHQ